ncbi:MAG: hypothetical protein GY882_03445 [Actinomycetia bacterium]|nr:hypothetical protein [Actinomycetes bacterium]
MSRHERPDPRLPDRLSPDRLSPDRLPAAHPIRQRGETFGLEGPNPWALPALHLLLSGAGRVFADDLGAFELAHPGTEAALERLVAAGFAVHQGPVLVDLDGELASRRTRRVTRFVLTAAGRDLTAELSADPLAARHHWVGIGRLADDAESAALATSVAGLLAAFQVPRSRMTTGTSLSGAAKRAGFCERRTTDWIERFTARGLLRRLGEQHSDVSEVAPAHHRPTMALCRQVRDVAEAVGLGVDELWRLDRRTCPGPLTGRPYRRPDSAA